jgi:hypothetical protein
MNHPQTPTAPISGTTPLSSSRRPANDSVYQIAIIIAALLLVISASLF